MHHFLRLLARFARFWWLTITLPRRERRSQAIWEDAQGTEPPPFDGVPSPMGHVELRGLWHNWEAVAKVSAAHNRRVDEWIKEHVDYRPETIVLEPAHYWVPRRDPYPSMNCDCGDCHEARGHLARQLAIQRGTMRVDAQDWQDAAEMVAMERLECDRLEAEAERERLKQNFQRAARFDCSAIPPDDLEPPDYN